MTKSKPIDAMTKIMEILTSLPVEERTRVLRAAAVLTGEKPSKYAGAVGDEAALEDESGNFTKLPPRARAWMKQYGVTADELNQIFQKTQDGAEIIAAHIPGRNRKEQAYTAYILTGIAQLLATGTASFPDRQARALCEASGCYDSANHSAYLRDRGNEFTGMKGRGWVLTAPGLKRAAEIIKELTKQRA